LPQRSPDFQTRWLDNALTGGEWSWACQGAGDEGPGDLAFLRREQFLELLPPRPPETQLDEPAENVLALLRQRGASFVTELAQPTGLPPTTIRAALWSLLRRGLVANDLFDVIRRGEAREEISPLEPQNLTRIMRSHARLAPTPKPAQSATRRRPIGF